MISINEYKKVSDEINLPESYPKSITNLVEKAGRKKRI